LKASLFAFLPLLLPFIKGAPANSGILGSFGALFLKDEYLEDEKKCGAP
jgi:hypothetical protein